MAWGMAVIWGLLSSYSIALLFDYWEAVGPLTISLLIFPGFGLILLYRAIKQTLAWHQFGSTHLSLDPFPGAIGGDVGGNIELSIPYKEGLVCEISLSCISSYVTHSTRNRGRSRRKKLIWQDSGYGQVEKSARGMQIYFRFTVPDGLGPTGEKSGDFYYWRLDVNAELPWLDFDRTFFIPVYATGEKSKLQHTYSSKYLPRGASETDVEAVLPHFNRGPVCQIDFPIFRQPISDLLYFVFGGIVIYIGFFLAEIRHSENWSDYLTEGLVMVVGVILLLRGSYTAFNSMRISWDGSQINVIRRVFGKVIHRREIPYSEVRGVELSKSGSTVKSWGKYRINYEVLAKTHAGDLVLAINLDSYSKAKLVVGFFREQFRLKLENQ
jgi:hypothetical protein